MGKQSRNSTIRTSGLKAPQALSPEDYVQGVRAGDRSILARALTLVESSREADRELAQDVLERCLPYAGRSMRVGITGVPGVGKSTFIEAMGNYLIDAGKKLAVLAIDPSSQKSRGSILGDKTRMESLSHDPRAFIRPSPAAGSLGGVAHATRQAILLCEAAGYDTILVETVGVGQSEIAVHSMVDFFLLLLLPGAGDELQGIKRGIMEMADAIVINKADGDNVKKANQARGQFTTALHLFPAMVSGWTPQVITCSALKGAGMDRVWDLVTAFRDQVVENGHFERNRQEQARSWMHEMIRASLYRNLEAQPGIKDQMAALEKAVMAGAKSPARAAQELLSGYRQ